MTSCDCGCTHIIGFNDSGPCRDFEQGRNGRCVYCDHSRACHDEPWPHSRDCRPIADIVAEKDAEIEKLKSHIELLKKQDSERESIVNAYHHLLNPSSDFYSWQRDWQDAARIVLGLPADATVVDINLALLLRDKESEQ